MSREPKVEWQARSITGRLLRSFDSEVDLKTWRDQNPSVGCELVKVTTMVEVEPVVIKPNE